MSAVSSILLFVVSASPPQSSRSFTTLSPSRATSKAPHPPGPGFGTELPSVNTPVRGSTADAAGAVDDLPDDVAPRDGFDGLASRHDRHWDGVQPGYRSTTAEDRVNESPQSRQVKSGMRAG